MLTYRQAGTTALKCMKALSALKAMAAKGFEQCDLFLLYQCGVQQSRTMGQASQQWHRQMFNMLQLDRVQNEAMRVILPVFPTTRDTPTETKTFMLDLSANQTESGAGQSILQCR